MTTDVLTLPVARCGALNKNGAQCRKVLVSDAWTCDKHAGWSDTASDEERHRLAELEIMAAIEHLAPAPSEAERRLASAQRKLTRLLDEVIRHGRRRIGGTALEGDVALALADLAEAHQDPESLEVIEMLRHRFPVGLGFDGNCRCSVCRETSAAQLVPTIPALAVPDAAALCHCVECQTLAKEGQPRLHEVTAYPYVTFAAWIGGEGAGRVPKRAAADAMKCLSEQAGHMDPKVAATVLDGDTPRWKRKKP